MALLRNLRNLRSFHKLTNLRNLLAIVALAFAGLGAAAEPPEVVNVNTADAETIARVLNGVGLKKAEAIVRHRETHGRFDSATDLTAVKGIGEATVKRNADKIVVSETPAKEQAAVE